MQTKGLFSFLINEDGLVKNQEAAFSVIPVPVPDSDPAFAGVTALMTFCRPSISKGEENV
jgi:hypothetical protein